MNPKLLLLTVQLELFHQLYNIVLFIENNSCQYCFCEKVHGCSLIYRHNGWCLICALKDRHSSSELEKIKKSSTKLINFARQLYRDLFELIEYDHTIRELWLGEFIHSGRSYSGEQWWVPLRDCIDSIFNK